MLQIESGITTHLSSNSTETFLLIFACFSLSVGCQTLSQQVYSSQLNEIEAAKKRGELSSAEYIQLKHQAQNAHERREAYDRWSIELITD